MHAWTEDHKIKGSYCFFASISWAPAGPYAILSVSFKKAFGSDACEDSEGDKQRIRAYFFEGNTYMSRNDDRIMSND